MSLLALSEDFLHVVAVQEAKVVDIGTIYARQPSWSPDGSRIAAVQGLQDIVIIDVPGGSATSLTSGTNPTWSHDGQRIAFDAEHEGKPTVFVVPAMGGTPVPIPGAHGVHPSWSPDGEWIAFASTRSGNWDIWIVRIEGGELYQVTTDSGADLEPTWSPDGLKIAFVSNRLGYESIFMATDLETIGIQATTWSEMKLQYR